MDGSGPEVKRPRQFYEAPLRMPPQQPPAPSHPPAPHGQPGILPAPSPYPPPQPQLMQQPPPPPSPYHDISHDSRSLPDPHSYVQQHPHSGHTTPRDGRFQPEPDYPRRGSTSATPRSPIGDPHQYPGPPQRPMNIATTTEPQHYGPQYPHDPAGPMPTYPPPDAHLNGNSIQPHANYMHPHEQPPPTPTYAGDGYMPSPGTAGPHQYSSLPYGHPAAGHNQRPKKGNRAQQACDVCRTRKSKCDERKPRCSTCEEAGSACNYQSVAPAKLDRANQVILEQLEDHKRDFNSFKDVIGPKLERIEQLLSSQPLAPKVNTAMPEETDSKSNVRKAGSPVPAPMSNPKSLASSAQYSTTAKEGKLVDASPSGSFNTNPSEASSQDLPSVAKQNAIQTEHNTAAQKLFRWPSIRNLLRECKDLKFGDHSEGYVMEMELRKGPLHLYGRGQGPDPGDGSQTGASAASPASNGTGGPSDEASSASSPASSVEMGWGYGFNPYVGDSSSEGNWGGLCPDNSLKLDSQSITFFHQSYMQNLHILHPFLDESALSKTIESFKKRYGTPSDSGSGKTTFALPVSNANLEALREQYGGAGFNKAVKRKHSDGQFWPEGNASHFPLNPKPMLERSPATATVLLVMALGKICGCREALPGPVPANNSNAPRVQSPAGLRTDSPPPYSQPMRNSPSSSSYTTTQSPATHARSSLQSPRSTAGDAVPPGLRNVDVIPGLAYYAMATDILGNMTGSHDIIYVQCCLLAGLYAGQLANSVESLVWIQSASRGCCILVRDPALKSYRKARQNSIRLAFYTALQLESDILAEIDLPPSGIRRIENVAYPDGYFPEDAQPMSNLPHRSEVMRFYSYQLHLRNLLDCIQLEVYPPGMELTDSAKNKNMRDLLHDWLETDWRSALPPEIDCTEKDRPPRDINQARLRGKYFGALYIIHRPMVHYALELESKGELNHYLAQGEAQNFGAMAPPKTPINSFQGEVLNSARIAIEAAIQSTQAFDEAMSMKRLIVTNIFGTAHAQFGNMLVLSAVYRSKCLKQFISNTPSNSPKTTMTYLFKRTISFLKTLKPISATLGHDASILECLQRYIFENDEDDPMEVATSLSFG